MRTEMKFTRQTNFTGRNGFMKCSGIEILGLIDNKVMISPLTSKGQVGRCDIAVPVENLLELAQKLQQAYHDYKK